MSTKGTYYPLTHPQMAQWYRHQFFPDTGICNIVASMSLLGHVDLDFLAKAINLFIEKNEGMRLKMIEVEGEPSQYVADHFDREFSLIDFSDQGFRGVHNYAEFRVNEPFELLDSDLFEFVIWKIGELQGGFFVRIHHLISDAWTMTLMGTQITDYYNKLTRNDIPMEFWPSYLDFVCQEAEYKLSSEFEIAQQYWMKTYNTVPELATLKPRERMAASTSALRKEIVLSDEFTHMIRKSRTHGFILFLAAISIYVSRVTGKEDIVIGTPILGRSTKKDKNTIGMFIDWLPLRLAVNEELTFSDYIRYIRNSWREASRHRYPIDLLMEEIRNRHYTNTNLFDVILSYQKAKFAIEGDYETHWYFNRNQTEALVISVNDRENTGQLTLEIDYKDELFDENEIDRLFGHLMALLEDGISNPEKHLHELRILTESEQRQLIDFTVGDKKGSYILDAKGRLLPIGYTGDLYVAGEASNGMSYPDPFQPGKFIYSTGQCACRLQDGRLEISEDKREQQFTEVPVKIAATFTAEPVGDYINWWGKQFGYALDVGFTSYNQVFQELLNPESSLATNSGVNVLLVRFEDYIRDELGNDEVKTSKLQKVYIDLIDAIGQFANTAPMIMALFPVSTHLELSSKIKDTILELNDRLADKIKHYRHVYLLNLIDVQDAYMINDIFDEWKDREGHMPFTDEYYAAFGTEIARKIIAIKKQHFKVIVVDCDNTLWNGICGEVGTLGIRIDGGYRKLQEFLIQKQSEGLVLAVCSKNNEADVYDVFEQNPDMVLKREHIVSWRVNWQEKSQNIKEIARELNLGLDSFIFLDDNPLECAKMVEECPEVLTLQLPEAEADIPTFLQHVWALDRARVTKEDAERSSMYAAEQQRTSMKSTALSLDEFLKGLNLKVSMRFLQDGEIERAAQLTQRTNQFNLSTIRRSEQDIQSLMNDDQYACFIIEAADRFGDYGIVGLVILKSGSNELFIDTFLMSCRVLGRRVEDVVLSGIRRYAKERGKTLILAQYIPTKKNQLILEFIENAGWAITKKDDIVTEYSASVAHLPEIVDFIDFYYNERYSAAIEKPIAEPISTIVIDHVAIATQDLEDCGHYFSRLGYSKINSVKDPLQNSLLSIYESQKYVPLEFVAPVDENSPSYTLLESVGEAPYHLCFKVPNIQEFLSSLSNLKFEVISPQKPALLFDDKPVAFIMVHQVGLIELLETGVYATSTTPGFSNSTIRMAVGDPDNASSLFKLLGYTQVKSSRDSRHNIIITMAGQCREKLELVIPQNEQSEAFRFMSERGAGIFQLVFDIDREPIDLGAAGNQLVDAQRRYNVFFKSGQIPVITKMVAPYNTDQLEKTRHREYLLPVKYMTGDALLRLPVYENTSYRTRIYQAPRNETEELLVHIWEEVLKVEHIGIDDTFFELGGDSLKVLRVMTKLIAYGWKLSVKDFFTYPTIKQLADLIKGKAELNHENKETTATVFPECIPHQVDSIYLIGNKLELGAVLLTGATGFLGVHLLDELVSMTDGKIYCLVRGQNPDHARLRLIERLQHYFPGNRGKTISDRLIVISGDCSITHFGLPDSQYQVLGETIQTIIHSAALVKFYGIWEEFSLSNVRSTENIIGFCNSYGIRLAHISTESVSGNHLVEQELQDVLFTENSFFVGQNYLGNAYVRSKFESELMVLKAIHEGLSGQIFRMGIITGRYRDGLFQSNIDENAQYNRLKFLIDVGMVPEELLMQDVQFTPVDLASRAVVLLMQARETWGKVFHVYNNKFSTVKQLLQAAGILDLNVTVTDYETFSSRLRAIANDPVRKDLIAKIVPDLTSDYRLEFEDNITMDNSITCKYLKQLGFEWPEIDTIYLVKVLRYMLDQGFIDSSKRLSIINIDL